MSIKNKILEVIKGLGEPINTEDLAELCDINYKNISRYLKELESEDKIERKRSGRNTIITLKIIKPKIKPKIISESIMKPISRKKVFQDKDMNKEEIINWISKFIRENETQYTLDFLRGQKLIYETINEMRK